MAAETTMLTAARQYLVGQAPVTSRVSTRVFLDVAPPDCPLPFIVLLEVDTDPTHASGQAAGVREARLEVSCVANTSLSALQVAKAVNDALDGYQGTWTDDSVPVQIDAVLADDSRQWYDAQRRARVRQLDYLVHHRADQ